MKHLLLLSLCIVATACNVKIKSDKPADPVDNKPATCPRSLVKEVPADFSEVGVMTAAVRTLACETLAVGQNPSGEIVMAKYNSQGQRDATFGAQGVSQPLLGRYGNLNVRIERMAIVNDGFFALGSVEEADGSRSFFAFRFLDSGFLDLGFGPRRDGVVRAPKDARFSLVSLGAPVVESDRMRLMSRFVDNFSGTQVDREQVLLLSGSEAMPKELSPLPSTCDLINHQAYKDDTQYQITQNNCSELVWRSTGPSGSDALTMVPNGTTYFSNLLGEMRWNYEGTGLVLLSRDGLGFVKKEFVNFVQGQSFICGENVDARRRYLVFSPVPNTSGEWLNTCWYL